MPPTDYLTASAITRALHHLATTFPSICEKMLMPEKSIEGINIFAIKIANGTGAKRRGVLFLGGVHARELVNPDALVSLAFKLCQSYTDGTGLTFGGKSFDADVIKVLIDAMDIFILPLVNPDGRNFVQSPMGDAMWRKNRNPNPGLLCEGVDVNRNFEFLFDSGIHSSTSSCSLEFRGDHAFSEPETRNVRHMLDTFPNILGMVDVHSFSEFVLLGWGDDDNQTTDPDMNFRNAAFDGLRGTTSDTVYKEFIAKSDLDSFVKMGNRMRDAISAVRGRVYIVKQAALVYPTGVSATSQDYAYSRHIVDGAKRKVFAFTLETGREFQPLIPEAMDIISEVSAALIEFCMATLCVVEHTLAATAFSKDLDGMRDFRDEEMLATAAGRKYARLLEDNGIELMRIMLSDKKLRKQAIELTKPVNEAVKSRKTSKPKVISANIIGAAEKLLQSFASKASPELKKAIAEVRQDLKHFRGKTVLNGLESVSKAQSDAPG